MITIHEKTAQKFDTLGLGALLSSSCVVKEELNGSYELKMSHSYDKNGKWKRIERGRIIYAPTKRGMQPFRIYHVKPTMDGITVNARHIFYDMLDNQCSEISFNGTASGALAALQGAFVFAMPFSFDTDISVSGEMKTGRMNPVQVLLSDDDETTSFAKGFGGELLRDGFHVSLLTAMGQDRGVTIRYGKNLVGLDVTEDEADVKTRIQYHGSDGSGTLDSPFINEYVYPKIHLLEDENKTKAELKAEAQALFDGGIDIPLVNIKVDFIVLADTVEYADYAPLEEVFLGDIVTIINQKMNFAKMARVISYEWDCLLEKYNEVELGDFMPTLASSVTSGVRSGSLASSASVTASAVSAMLQAHINDKDNPHEVTAAQTGSSSGGSTDTDADAVLELLVEHEENKENPHGVTLSQVGFMSGTDDPNDINGNDGDVYLQIGSGTTTEQNTLFLLHGDEVVDATGQKQITNNGVVLSTDESKFGSGSLYFDGSTHLTFPSIDFGADDFTIDWWEYVTDANAGSRFISAYSSDFDSATVGTGGILVGIAASGANTVYVSAKTAYSWDVMQNQTAFSTNAYSKWVHRAVVRSGNNLMFFTDGELERTYSIGTATIGYNEDLPFCIGRFSEDLTTTGFQFIGYIEEFRISNVARWTENFAVPTEAYSPETATVGSLWLKQNGAWIQVLKGVA